MREPRPDWSPLGVKFKILDEHPYLSYISSPHPAPTPPPPECNLCRAKVATSCNFMAILVQFVSPNVHFLNKSFESPYFLSYISNRGDKLSKLALKSPLRRDKKCIELRDLEPSGDLETSSSGLVTYPYAWPVSGYQASALLQPRGHRTTTRFECKLFCFSVINSCLFVDEVAAAEAVVVAAVAVFVAVAVAVGEGVFSREILDLQNML